MFITSLLIATLLTQEPVVSSGYAEDVRCMAVLNLAEGLLRSSDQRRLDVAAAIPPMTARMESYLSDGTHDEGQIVIDLQSAANTHRPTYEAELADCFAHAAALEGEPGTAPQA